MLGAQSITAIAVCFLLDKTPDLRESEKCGLREGEKTGVGTEKRKTSTREEWLGHC